MAGQIVGAGSGMPTSGAIDQVRPKCNAQPSKVPTTPPSNATSSNSPTSTCINRVCVMPSALPTAQASRWRCANRRAANATATAAINADSKGAPATIRR